FLSYINCSRIFTASIEKEENIAKNRNIRMLFEAETMYAFAILTRVPIDLAKRITTNTTNLFHSIAKKFYSFHLEGTRNKAYTTVVLIKKELLDEKGYTFIEVCKEDDPYINSYETEHTGYFIFDFEEYFLVIANFDCSPEYQSK